MDNPTTSKNLRSAAKRNLQPMPDVTISQAVEGANKDADAQEKPPVKRAKENPSAAQDADKHTGCILCARCGFHIRRKQDDV